MSFIYYAFAFKIYFSPDLVSTYWIYYDLISLLVLVYLELSHFQTNAFALTSTHDGFCLLCVIRTVWVQLSAYCSCVVGWSSRRKHTTMAMKLLLFYIKYTMYLNYTLNIYYNTRRFSTFVYYFYVVTWNCRQKVLLVFFDSHQTYWIIVCVCVCVSIYKSEFRI
jgi:hypothetical protein